MQVAVLFFLTNPRDYDILKSKKRGDRVKSLRIEIPKDVRTLIGELESAGFTAYIVGGSVRDAVMGKTPNDYDICTSASPDEMKRVFQGRNVIETGLQHGTLTVVGDENHYEITTYRVDGDYCDHRHPQSVVFVDNIEEDLARRDFTVNAMAYNEKTGLVDPFGGVRDIERKIIRCVGDPDKRFTEDALRVMRAVRFASVCGSTIEENTKKAMFLHKNLLKNVSEERKTAEFRKMLISANADILLTYKEIFATFIPEIIPSFGFDQKNRHHRYDVYEHSAHAVALAPQDLIVRLALFFHDVGKPRTFTVDENETGHFYDHAKESAIMTETAMKRMKFDTATLRLVEELVEFHGLAPTDSPKYARKLLNRLGETQVKRLLTLARCDVGAQAIYEERDSVFQRIDSLEKNIDDALAKQQCFSVKNLAVNGNDLKSLGIREGKEIGRLLNLLLDAVLETPELNEKKALLRLAQHEKNE